MTMSNRLVPILSLLCGVVCSAYIVLVIATIFFATWQTELSLSVRTTESRISVLETEYYDAITKLNTTNVASAGFIAPIQVEYVSASGKPTVTFVPTATR